MRRALDWEVPPLRAGAPGLGKGEEARRRRVQHLAGAGKGCIMGCCFGHNRWVERTGGEGAVQRPCRRPSGPVFEWWGLLTLPLLGCRHRRFGPRGPDRRGCVVVSRHIISGFGGKQRFDICIQRTRPASQLHTHVGNTTGFANWCAARASRAALWAQGYSQG
jgi:hypothetical protein